MGVLRVISYGHAHHSARTTSALQLVSRALSLMVIALFAASIVGGGHGATWVWRILLSMPGGDWALMTELGWAGIVLLGVAVFRPPHLRWALVDLFGTASLVAVVFHFNLFPVVPSMSLVVALCVKAPLQTWIVYRLWTTGNEGITTVMWTTGIVIFAMALWMYGGSYIHSPSRSRTNTAREMSVFGSIVRQYAMKHHEVPGPSIGDATRQIMADPSLADDFREYCGMIISDRDAWGHRFTYAHESATKVYLRSWGDNGIDDNGGGDDIQIIVNINGLFEADGESSRHD